MKRKYEKPVVEVLNFELSENIMGDIDLEGEDDFVFTESVPDDF